MKKTNLDPLKDLIAPNLYDKYSSILSLSDIPLLLIDSNGKVIVELIPAPDFCSHICQNSKGHLCSDYIRQIDSEKLGRFQCRHGLENIIIPVQVHNDVLGYIVGIMAFTKNNEYKKHLIDVHNLKNESLQDLEVIAKSISSLKVVDSSKIEVHEQLSNQIAKNISIDLFGIVNESDSNIQKLSIEKEILEKKIIELEAKNMSLAVNPHFLFNTLNCIARIAHFENSTTTEELIYYLSDLLRYNLKQNNNLHTISAEIDNIEKYLYIQKVRFRNRLNYSIDIPESIKAHKIPNMVIQPIVENAIIHGISPKRDGGEVKIYAVEDKNNIVFYVCDNGNGFPKDVLEDLRKTGRRPGLGFQNTDNRLKRYYGEEYGLDIIKSDYSGSTVTITIPKNPVKR